MTTSDLALALTVVESALHPLPSVFQHDRPPRTPQRKVLVVASSGLHLMSVLPSSLKPPKSGYGLQIPTDACISFTPAVLHPASGAVPDSQISQIHIEPKHCCPPLRRTASTSTSRSTSPGRAAAASITLLETLMHASPGRILPDASLHVTRSGSEQVTGRARCHRDHTVLVSLKHHLRIAGVGVPELDSTILGTRHDPFAAWGQTHGEHVVLQGTPSVFVPLST